MRWARAAWQNSREHCFAFLGYALFTTLAFFGILLAWYAQRFQINTPVPWPSFELLKEATLKERSVALADVGWMVGAVTGGYERFPTDGSDPYAIQHNWAYFPLTIYLGKIVNVVTRDAWWSLQIISIASVAGLLTFARALRRTWATAVGPASPALAQELLLVFFVLPVTWASINFTVLPMLLEYALFFTVLRLAREGARPSRTTIGLVITLAMLTAFARSQGLVIDLFLAVAVLLHVREPSVRLRAVVVGALLAPIGCLLFFYKFVVGNPLAWYHVQRAWGRKSTMPWTPWIDELKSGLFLGPFSSSALIGLRLVVIVVAIGWAVRSWSRDLRKGERSPAHLVEGWLLITSLALCVLPFTTGTILGGHRLLCFSMYPFLARPERNLGIHLPAVVLLGFVFLRVLETAFFFLGAFFVMW